MFTGLIREVATVKSFNNGILTINSNHKAKLGDSIAINGSCLTVISVGDNSFSVEISDESRKILALKNYKDKVHIEPAMRLSDRVEGHIVQGHVDSVGVIKKIIKNSNSYDFFIYIDKEYIKYIAPKGSITIDGVSLTVNEVFEDEFRLTIISHTMQNTLFKDYKVGDEVNIETDLFARYIYNMIKKDKTNSLTWDSVNKILSTY